MRNHESNLISTVIVSPIPGMYFIILQDCKFRSAVGRSILSKEGGPY
jgi:hypothetical protein